MIIRLSCASGVVLVYVTVVQVVLVEMSVRMQKNNM